MKILELLGMDKEARKTAKIKRLGKALERGQDSLIDELEAERDDLLEKKEDLRTMKVDKVNLKTWNREYHDTVVALATTEEEIKIAKATMVELFSDTTTTTDGE